MLKAFLMNYLRLLWSLPLVAVLAACGGSGSTAPAPTHFQMTAQDSQLYMTWDALPGVEYRVFCDPNQQTINSHTTGSSTPSGRIYFYGIRSGSFYAAGLDTRGWATGIANGTPYACTVNGRIDNGPGGPDAIPQRATPRFAGAAWAAGTTTPLSGMTVQSVAYGYPTGLGLTADKFVAVGSGGKVAVSSAVGSDAVLTWGSPAQAADLTSALNAVIFSATGNRFIAVGDQGKVAYSSNTSTWTAVSISGASGVSLNGLANAGGAVIAVGSDAASTPQGYIYASSDSGSTWAAVTGVSTHALRSVVYVPATTPYWIAVGDGGAMLKSLNGSTWTSVSPAGTSVNFKSAAMLPVIEGTTVVSYRVVAVGDDGKAWESTNGDTWSAASVSAPTALVAVYAAKGQFMALDAAGKAYTSNATVGNWAWSAGVSTVPASPVSVLRYSPSFTAVSNGWMVFDATGQQGIAR